MNVERSKAEEIVAKASINTLSDKDISAILSEYWVYDSVQEIREAIEQDEMPAISDEAITFMSDNPLPEIPDREMFMPSILDMKIYELRNVINSYLKDKLSTLGYDVNIMGEPQKAGVCPCCRHYSIGFGEEGLWDICTVCFWENGGDGPNHMSLKEAQKNFKSIGAIDQQSMAFVDPEGPLKYERSL